MAKRKPDDEGEGGGKRGKAGADGGGGKKGKAEAAVPPPKHGEPGPSAETRPPTGKGALAASLAPTPKAVLPSSQREYRERLVKQKKEIYKDPPALPPLEVRVLPGSKPEPKRNADGELVFADQAKFRPNLTPKQVMQLGSFGGTYFRPIVSAVTGESYRNIHREFPADWFAGLDEVRQVVSASYDPSVNRYGVKCGGSLGMWESSGWISPIDPYGWFHWYCRFYLGRRSTDDERQIDRWLKGQGPTGRWRTQLCNKVLQTKAKRWDDPKVSPVIRMTCQHWAYELTEGDMKKHAAKQGMKL